MITHDAGGAEERLHQAKVPFVSSGSIGLDRKLGFRKGLLVRDPDGHVVELAEK
jgi:hypothetical protein